jgi:hypothetical protein
MVNNTICRDFIAGLELFREKAKYNVMGGLWWLLKHLPSALRKGKLTIPPLFMHASFIKVTYLVYTACLLKPVIFPPRGVFPISLSVSGLTGFTATHQRI